MYSLFLQKYAADVLLPFVYQVCTHSWQPKGEMLNKNFSFFANNAFMPNLVNPLRHGVQRDVGINIFSSGR